MAGRPRKTPDRRQGTQTRDVGLVSLVPSPLSKTPPPEKKWLAQTVEDWEGYWSDPISTIANQTSDMPALKRLFGMRDKVYRYERAADGKELIEGSQGQLRINPLLKQRDDLLTEIRQLEDRFGLTPKARLQLGAQFGETHRSLEQLNQAIASGDDEDPRLQAVDTEASSS